MTAKHDRYLLLVLTGSVWFVAIAVASQLPTHRDDVFVYSCTVAVWQAQASIAAILVPLAGKRSLWLVAIALLVSVASYTIYWPQSSAVNQGDEIVTFSLYQIAAILPVAVLIRWLGFRLIRESTSGERETLDSRQFTLQTLLLWTAIAALYCLLIRSIDHGFVQNWMAAVVIIAVRVFLVWMVTWASLGVRGVFWRTAILVTIMIVSAKMLAVLFRGVGTLSALQYSMYLGFPLLLVWLTFVTLRAFGWRLTARQAQPLPPAAARAPAENA